MVEKKYYNPGKDPWLYKNWAVISFFIGIGYVLYISFAFNELVNLIDGVLFSLFAVILLKQFEMHKMPGGAIPWLNKAIYKSENPYFPITRQKAFIMNALILWPLSFICFIIVGSKLIILPLILIMVVALYHSWFLISYSVGESKYVPGVISSIFLVIPLTWYIIFYYAEKSLFTVQELIFAFFVGLFIHGCSFIYFRKLKQDNPDLAKDPALINIEEGPLEIKEEDKSSEETTV